MDHTSLFHKFKKQDGGLVFGLFLISSMSICFLFVLYGVFGISLVVVFFIYLFGSLFVQVMKWMNSGYLRCFCVRYLVKDIGVFLVVLVLHLRYGSYDLLLQIIKYGQYWLNESQWIHWSLGSKWYCGRWWMILMWCKQDKWKYGSGDLVLVTERQNFCYLKHGGYGFTSGRNNTQNSYYGIMWFVYYELLPYCHASPVQRSYGKFWLQSIVSFILKTAYNVDVLIWITGWWFGILLVSTRYQDIFTSISLSSMELFKEFLYENIELEL